MEENILKKEFNVKDVNRIRNIVQKKYGEATNTQVGYQKESKDYQEGDIWEENGKQWTIKKGLKQNITKLDEFKKLAIVPLLCPNCNNPMKTANDNKMYFIHKMCMDCVIKFETHLKINGQYQKYADDLRRNNINHYLKEYREFLEDALRNVSSQTHISEDGIIEKWIGSNKEVIEKHLKNIK